MKTFGKAHITYMMTLGKNTTKMRKFKTACYFQYSSSAVQEPGYSDFIYLPG